MTDRDNTTPALTLADLPQNRPTPFRLTPDAAALTRLAEDLGLLGLRKLRFEGEVAPQGKTDWLLTGQLGATVVQPCVATLEPVTTRVETLVRRQYVADYTDPDDPEAEMPEDDEVEPLPRTLHLDNVMAEALSLALPLYPRAAEAAVVELRVTEPGKRAMTDDEARPFAGLAGLRDALSEGEDEDKDEDGAEN